MQLFRPAPTASAVLAADPSTIPACGGNPECFAFSINTRLTSTGATTGTSTTFSVPVSGQVGLTNQAYNWIINWGDGTAEQTASGTSGTTSAGITHDYVGTGAGQYQITIRPTATAAAGWFNAFGFYSGTSGANVAANKDKFLSIDTPFTNLMRTEGATYRFAYVFYEARNGTEIPSNLFANISTASTTNFNSVFSYTFYSYAYNSTTATIPAGLFGSLNTSGGTNFNSMFSYTFYHHAYNSTTATIPAGLFGSLDTSNGTDFGSMFNSTLNSYARNSSATIPAGLFNSLDTSSGTIFSSMFRATFSVHAYNSTSAAIPSDLFSSLNTSNGTNFSNMFSYTFSSYAYNSTAATIPANLFSSLNTSSGTNFNGMFSYTFGSYAYNSTAATIPAGLFDFLNTSSGTNFGSMFASTFSSYAYNSTTGTIPAGLFDFLNTSSGTNFSSMFNYTFSSYAYNSTVGTIPAGLFGFLNTSSGTNFDNMFSSTFNNYARRVASFKVNGSIVATSSQFSNPYSVKIGPTGTPSTNPLVNATTASQVIPTYNSTVRSITAPDGAYAGYEWYRTDGTSCTVASPTPDCGAQDSTTIVTFPNNTEWAETISTEKGNATFYAGPAAATISNVTVNGWTSVGLAPKTATISLTNTKVSTALPADTDISSWFNAPTGITVTTTSAVPANAASIPVTFSGTPTANSSAAITITIPVSYLTSTGSAVTAATNQDATWDITTAFAAIYDITVNGQPDIPLTPQSCHITLTNITILSGTSFRNLPIGTDITNWFTNIPDGLVATVTATITSGATEILPIEFSGTPTLTSTSIMTVTIPGSALTSGAGITIATNPNAKWNITIPPPPPITVPTTGIFGSNVGSAASISATCITALAAALVITKRRTVKKQH